VGEAGEGEREALASKQGLEETKERTGLRGEGRRQGGRESKPFDRRSVDRRDEKRGLQQGGQRNGVEEMGREGGKEEPGLIIIDPHPARRTIF
jgi:hypothetical protein